MVQTLMFSRHNSAAVPQRCGITRDSLPGDFENLALTMCPVMFLLTTLTFLVYKKKPTTHTFNLFTVTFHAVYIQFTFKKAAKMQLVTEKDLYLMSVLKTLPTSFF